MPSAWRVEASRIDADKAIGVVLFKTSLSTGWDCPRAEVMMSFRAAQDHTYIAQLLGRMAWRIGRDAALNDVHLFVPYFDAVAVKAVVEDLSNVEDVQPSETGSARELVISHRSRSPHWRSSTAPACRPPEIPYNHGGEVRPMFPDLVIVCQTAGSEGFRFDILEPHDPSLGDNVEKAVGLARFAERHGHLFERIQLIRRQRSPAGGEAFFRLEINRTTIQKKLLLVTTNAQLDALFEAEATSTS